MFTNVYHVIEYTEANKSVNNKKGVKTPQNLTKPQEDFTKKLPPLQLHGSMIHLSELIHMNEFLCLLILVCILDYHTLTFQLR